MPALICGSLAFDTITTFPGRFAEQILPEQVHILNVSFLVPTLRREWGGCAGNIAYNLQAIGGQPVILAALGVDGGEYIHRVQGWGADTSLIHRDTLLHTAQCHITTDRDNNQITAFHPGAMSHAHQMAVPPRSVRSDLAIGIIAPDGRDAMWQHAHQMAEAGIPFIFDPGQQLPQFNGDEHREILTLARHAPGQPPRSCHARVDLRIPRLRHHHHLPWALCRADPARAGAHPERQLPGADAAP